MTEGSVYLFISILILKWGLSCQAQNSTLFKRSNDAKRYMSLFTRVTKTDMLKCAKLCSQYTKCTSYIYEKHNSECSLYKTNASVSTKHGTSSIQHFYIKLQDKDVNEVQLIHEEFQHNHDIHLHQACLTGRLDEVKYILSHGKEDINSQDKHGRTPVMRAAEGNQLEVVNYLVKRGCNVSMTDSKKCDVLYYACYWGLLRIVKILVNKAKCNIESKNVWSRTPVMAAVETGKTSMVDFLVAKHCNLKAVDKHGDTVFHVACVGGNVNMVMHVLTLNVNYLECRNKYGWTPVMVAVRNGHQPVVNLLASKHCNMKVVNRKGENILHMACGNTDVNMVKYVLSLGIADIDSRDKNEHTPVMLAALEGLQHAIEFLASKHCNMKAVNKYGQNILHMACKSRDVDMVKHVLSFGVVDIDSRDKTERTPVMIAVRRGRQPVVEFLASKHCNMKAVNIDGQNILHLACESKDVNKVKYVLSLRVVDIDSRDKTGYTPVMIAVSRGCQPLVKFLVSEHCNTTSTNYRGHTLLHLAGSGGHVDILKYVLSLDVIDIESRDTNRRTPVMYAVGRGQYNTQTVVDLLVSKHCNLTVVDRYGNNVIHLACGRGDADLVKHLLSLGVWTRKEKNKKGQTPAQLARKHSKNVQRECNIN